jgi:Zn-dependent protease with chaperone function
MSMRSVRSTRVALSLLAAACVLSGCTTNPVTGRSQLMIVSEKSALSGSASAYSSMLGGLAKKGQVESGTPREARVREITDRLIAQAVRFRPDSAGWDWQISVINDPKVVNAFCMAGGKMAIYTGMWEKLHATDDEIANVMGHEIGHALANHTQERMSVAMTTTLGAALLAVAVAPSNDASALSRNTDAFSAAAALAVTLPNSRGGESEADRIGIELAARAGFDPRAAVTLWEKMAKQGGAQPEFLSTHPSPEHRMKDLQALVDQVDPHYRSALRADSRGNAPSFLSGSVNERRVGEPSRQEYAAQAQSQADTLSFLSEPFDKFKRGATVLDCRVACGVSFALRRSDWKKLHAAAAWRDLAVSVLQVGYLSDLSYFLLGEAARGLGLPDAAKAYYAHARDAGRSGYGCAGGIDACAGFDVQRQAAAR